MSFERLTSDRALIYLLKSELNDVLAGALQNEIKLEMEIENNFDLIILNLQAHELHYKSFKKLGAIGLDLKKSKRHFYLLSKKTKIHKMIKAEGLDNIIQPISTVEEVMRPPAPSNVANKIDVSMINPFIDAAIHVLNTQAQVEIKPGKPEMGIASQSPDAIDISALLLIQSKGFNGGIALCFPKTVFLGVMSKMFGEYFSEITPELEDGASEILNIIFGQAKKILNEAGHKFTNAIPTVLRGKAKPANFVASKYVLTLPFRCEFGNFHMQISTEESTTLICRRVDDEDHLMRHLLSILVLSLASCISPGSKKSADLRVATYKPIKSQRAQPRKIPRMGATWSIDC